MNIGCTGKTVRSPENACHTWAPYMCVHDETLCKSTFSFTFTLQFYYETDIRCSIVWQTAHWVLMSHFLKRGLPHYPQLPIAGIDTALCTLKDRD